LNHANLGWGDPSNDKQDKVTTWPSLKVSFCGSPVISGGLGGSKNKNKKR